METTKNQMIIKDQTIIAFYKENPNLDFIMMNHIFIDILKKLSTNLSDTINNNINNKILSTLTDMSKDIQKLNTDITTRLHDSKKEYIEDVKLILSNNSLSNSEKISSILEKNNDTLITKTNLLVNEIIPKNQEKYYSQIDSTIKNLYTSISQDTNRLFENINKDEKVFKEYVENIELQFNKMIQNIQQPIFSFIQSSEERTTTNIQQMKDKLTSQQGTQEVLSNEMNVFLNKYKYNSSKKGDVSETELYYVIQQVFPSDEIIDCRSETASCDYRVNRLNKDKPTILFENKDYTRSATTEEVNKFERDLKIQRCHGVFLSQNSFITYKENLQIDIIDGLIHVYIPNAQYSHEKVKLAVDIIDNLSSRLKTIQNHTENTTVTINKEDLIELTEVFCEYTKQKNQLIDIVKSSNKQILDKIEEMQLIVLKKILVKNGLLLDEDDFKCKFCNSFTGKNKASLGAHVRTCKQNPTNFTKNEIIVTSHA